MIDDDELQWHRIGFAFFDFKTKIYLYKLSKCVQLLLLGNTILRN